MTAHNIRSHFGSIESNSKLHNSSKLHHNSSKLQNNQCALGSWVNNFITVAMAQEYTPEGTPDFVEEAHVAMAQESTPEGTPDFVEGAHVPLLPLLESVYMAEDSLFAPPVTTAVRPPRKRSRTTATATATATTATATTATATTATGSTTFSEMFVYHRLTGRYHLILPCMRSSPFYKKEMWSQLFSASYVRDFSIDKYFFSIACNPSMLMVESVIGEHCSIDQITAKLAKYFTKSRRRFYLGITEDPLTRLEMHWLSPPYGVRMKTMFIVAIAPTSAITGLLEKQGIAIMKRSPVGALCLNVGKGGERPSHGVPHHLYCMAE